MGEVARPNVEVERKQQIMLSACEIIASKGVLGLRVSDVAKGAGVSPGIVHYYFDSKLELIRASFDDNFTRSLERRSVIFENRADHAADVLIALVESYSPVGHETVQAWHVWIELWAAALQDDELKAVHNRAYNQWAEIIEGVISRGQHHGQLVDTDNASAVAYHLIGLLDGLSVQVLLGSQGMNVFAMRTICVRFVDSLRVAQS